MLVIMAEAMRDELQQNQPRLVGGTGLGGKDGLILSSTTHGGDSSIVVYRPIGVVWTAAEFCDAQLGDCTISMVTASQCMSQIHGSRTNLIHLELSRCMFVVRTAFNHMAAARSLLLSQKVAPWHSKSLGPPAAL